MESEEEEVPTGGPWGVRDPRIQRDKNLIDIVNYKHPE